MEFLKDENIARDAAHSFVATASMEAKLLYVIVFSQWV